MSLNEGAKIVPKLVATDYLLTQNKVAFKVVLPSGYGRVQLLTESALKELVFAAHDRSYILYGELSSDFPICSDFSAICDSDVRREAIKQGLAVRPAFGQVYFTRNNPPRHAINFGILVSGEVLYYEPQSDTWMDEPKDLLSLDEFKW